MQVKKESVTEKAAVTIYCPPGGLIVQLRHPVVELDVGIFDCGV